MIILLSDIIIRQHYFNLNTISTDLIFANNRILFKKKKKTANNIYKHFDCKNNYLITHVIINFINHYISMSNSLSRHIYFTLHTGIEILNATQKSKFTIYFYICNIRKYVKKSVIFKNYLFLITLSCHVVILFLII